ncbi:hypothetical protein N9L26_01500 [Candidatus Pacebacteria bacterium]|nr:hypothetical protein [Candidatus Paceibacterota bacterium]
MDANDILKATDSAKRLIQDEQYYKYIFKKTERIVSVVFYILNNVPETERTQMHIEDIQHAARTVHDAVIQSLESRVYAAEDIVRGVAHALISLQSKLTVAQVAGVIAPHVLSVFEGEIDAVLRGANRYIGEETDTFASLEDSPTPTPKPASRAKTPSNTAVQTTPTQSSGTGDRRERIKTILEAKGEASIKDISDIITDVSEKTVQRELNAMIEDNVVKRQGERRWSRYSLF